eukprot:7185084-Pyramimonas_sp.AAC.1
MLVLPAQRLLGSLHPLLPGGRAAGPVRVRLQALALVRLLDDVPGRVRLHLQHGVVRAEVRERLPAKVQAAQGVDAL